MKWQFLVAMDFHLIQIIDSMMSNSYSRLGLSKINLQRLVILLYFLTCQALSFSVILILVFQSLQEISLNSLGPKSYNTYIESIRFDAFNIVVRVVCIMFGAYFILYDSLSETVPSMLDLISRVIWIFYFYLLYSKDFTGTPRRRVDFKYLFSIPQANPA